ncbi:hypothetical protein [Mesorhizobium sp. Z1-4]
MKISFRAAIFFFALVTLSAAHAKDDQRIDLVVVEKAARQMILL